MTGPALGRPKSATFRTMDIAGIDILAHVAGEPAASSCRRSSRRSIEKRMGRREGRSGLLQAAKRHAAAIEILTLDPATLDLPRRSSRRGSRRIEAAQIDRGHRRAHQGAVQRRRTRSATFLREHARADAAIHGARCRPDIAYSTDDVDRVMRWGFGWELGPFEIMEAIGPECAAEARVRLTRRASGGCETELRASAGDLLILKSAARTASASSARTPGASLVDLGDGVLALEFHVEDERASAATQIQMMHAGVKEAAANFAALVVGNDAPNFSAGANLMLLLLEAQEGNWDEIDLMIRAFQGVDAGAALRRRPGRSSRRPA